MKLWTMALLAIEEFKIDAFRETTTRQTLVDYLNGPLRKIELCLPQDK